MNKDSSKNLYFSAFAFRTALSGTIGTAIVLFIILKFGTEIPPPDIILLTASGAFSVGLIVYLYLFFVNRRRFRMLHQISKNITRKIFEDYDNVTIKRRDEVDLLTKRLILASKTVEKEILRLNKIENYRKEFIGDISHELKTPIFAIQGFLETLLNGALDDPEVNEVFLQKAMKNVYRLTYLTKDLMEISKLETGELKSNFQEIYLRDLVLDVVENLQYKSQKENVTIRVEEFDRNLQVKADRNQIKQVLINLIENAIKYNVQDGSVEIGMKPYAEDKYRVLLYVKDTGIGIDPKDIPRVTERFFRVDKSRSREKGGTGLGLSIVKHIIEAHGETLSIESSKGGTEFSFTLSKVNHILQS
jgi:two-component system phosphate regulon sensor histidine kinase PhoR